MEFTVVFFLSIPFGWSVARNVSLRWTTVIYPIDQKKLLLLISRSWKRAGKKREGPSPVVNPFLWLLHNARVTRLNGDKEHTSALPPWHSPYRTDHAGRVGGWWLGSVYSPCSYAMTYTQKLGRFDILIYIYKRSPPRSPSIPFSFSPHILLRILLFFFFCSLSSR